MKHIILITLLLSGCASTYTKQEIDAKFSSYGKAADQNFKNISNSINVLNERVFEKELKKGIALKCEKGFTLPNAECIK